MDDFSILTFLIEDIDSMYMDFSNSFYTLSNQSMLELCDIKNLKKYTVSRALSNGNFLEELVPKYLKALHEKIDKSIQDPFSKYFIEGYDIRYRIKLNKTIERKLKQYRIKEKEKGSFYVAKVLNDLLGVRIVLEDLNRNISDIREMLDRFVNDDYRCESHFKYYERNKEGYNGIHCYFQSKNVYFPWELQIWDKENAVQNYNAHRSHEEKRLEEAAEYDSLYSIG